jgi:hypothetical protein
MPVPPPKTAYFPAIASSVMMNAAVAAPARSINTGPRTFRAQGKAS